tara:strand:- start:14 stop:361 length:348 start_codon:yes stop_codon:yes gene_type:complete
MAEIPFDSIPVWLEPIVEELSDKEIQYVTSEFHPLSDPTYTKEVFDWFKSIVVRLNLSTKERAGIYVARTFPTRFQSLYESSYAEIHPDYKESGENRLNEINEYVKIRDQQTEEF